MLVRFFSQTIHMQYTLELLDFLYCRLIDLSAKSPSSYLRFTLIIQAQAFIINAITCLLLIHSRGINAIAILILLSDSLHSTLCMTLFISHSEPCFFLSQVSYTRTTLINRKLLRERAIKLQGQHLKNQYQNRRITETQDTCLL